MTRVSITVDFEPDCPPYLSSGFRGITEGAPALLALLSETGVRATYFTTGDVAERYPDAVRAVVSAGHELGCHGVTHTAFDTLDESRARWEIETSAATLRAFAPVQSFRAPYLRFPERYVPLLESAGFTLDSSLARYKRSYYVARPTMTLTRIPASVTSSVLRLPRVIRDPWLLALRDPVVLFVHPWEFVDLTREGLRYDCRFRTGAVALRCLREVIALLRARGDSFVPMRELVAPAVPE
jgi:peptidoglycan/xylan/chitin deacetylase (PgdA/CDA1 family)